MVVGGVMCARGFDWVEVQEVWHDGCPQIPLARLVFQEVKPGKVDLRKVRNLQRYTMHALFTLAMHTAPPAE